MAYTLQTFTVTYSGTDIGKINLTDVKHKTGNQMRDGRGQETYLSFGEVLELLATSDVVQSLSSGQLRKLVDNGNVVVVNTTDVI